MCRLSRAISAVLFISFAVSIGSTQQTSTTSVPNLIRYGGTLYDPHGGPLMSSTAGVTFAIYKQQDGGAPIWMETQNVTTDNGGSYSVLLGSTTVTGLPGDLFSEQEQRWLGVEVQGQPEQPRVLLVSVPYAFKAHEAETLGGMSASDFMPANSASSLANGSSTTQSSSSTAANPSANSAIKMRVTTDGPTNFSGSTTNQIVAVTQSGTGAGLTASAASKAVVGTATATSGTAYGVEGAASGTGGVGVEGYASSGTGTTYGVKGIASSTAGVALQGYAAATSGHTIGVSGLVSSASGTAGVFNNTAGGTIISAYNGGASMFSVDGSGNVRGNGDVAGNGSVVVDAGGVNNGSSYFPGLLFGSTGSTRAIASGTGGANPFGLDFYTGAEPHMSIFNNGQVNIGSQTLHSALLEVIPPQGVADLAGGYFVGANSPSGPGNDGIDAIAGFGPSGNGYAGNFTGDVNVTGAITAGTKDFRIDHPLDPANKYLYHASVESSEMMNIYTGNVTTDSQGDAVVQLPDWFEAVNTDFRYQLTVLGQFAQAIVASEISNHHFSIKTDKPSVKVSWQVTGVRQDPYAQAHPLQVEVEKPERERGYYIHPELYGAPAEKSIESARHPQLTKQMK